MFEFPVLVVDDEPQVRSLIRAVLSKAGFRVLEAVNGVKALSTVEALHGEISIMISDYSMPGLNGGTLAKLVRGQFPDIHILMVSSDANAPGCPSIDAFLPKPVAPSILIDAVRRILEDGSLLVVKRAKVD